MLAFYLLIAILILVFTLWNVMNALLSLPSGNKTLKPYAREVMEWES